MSWTVTFEGVDTSISGFSGIKEMATSDEKMSPESIFEIRVDSWGPVERGFFTSVQNGIRFYSPLVGLLLGKDTLLTILSVG